MSRFQFLTPDDYPSGVKAVNLYVPVGDDWEAIVRGALALLLIAENFEAYGAVTPEECIEEFADTMLDTFAAWG